MTRLAWRAEASGRPEGVIFLGEAQHSSGDGGGGGGDGGGVTAVEAEAPLLAIADGAGVVRLRLDLRSLDPLPRRAAPVPLSFVG